MKPKALLGTVVAATFLSVPAEATALLFTAGTANVGGSQTVTGQNFSDIFTFSTSDAKVVSSSITTHSLTVDGTIVEDLDFLAITLDGFDFINHNSSDANEQFSLPSTLLQAGDHTLTITYNVDVASAQQSAAYSGNVYLAAAAVPEPATWAMFVGAFGLVGGALRRRRTPAFA